MARMARPRASAPLPIARADGILEATRRDLAYLLVIAWACVGVAVRQADTQSMELVAPVMAAAVLALAVRGLIRRGEGRPAVVWDGSAMGE
jgi:hypothetical protein